MQFEQLFPTQAHRAPEIVDIFSLVPVLFSCLRYGMSDRSMPPLRPATPDEVEFTISHALRHKGKRIFHYSSEIMAKITTEHLVESLRQSGFVIMKQPPKEPGPSTHGPLGTDTKAHLTE